MYAAIYGASKLHPVHGRHPPARVPQVEAELFGSVPLKTFLPDGDIDVSILTSSPAIGRDTWATALQVGCTARCCVFSCSVGRGNVGHGAAGGLHATPSSTDHRNGSACAVTRLWSSHAL